MAWQDQRPMSPHLQIYKLPLTAKLSILHRITGAALFVALILMVMVLFALAAGEQNWNFVQAILSSWFGMLVLFGMTFSLYYHLCNGIRHLFWDVGMYMEKETLLQSGIAVIVCSIVLTVITWIIPFIVG